jgi:hypothetical protein
MQRIRIDINFSESLEILEGIPSYKTSAYSKSGEKGSGNDRVITVWSDQANPEF